MKKLFILAALIGVVGLTSCGGNGSNSATEAGQKVDSLVNEAQDAISNTADSVATGVENAADSVKAAADSMTDGK